MEQVSDIQTTIDESNSNPNKVKSPKELNKILNSFDYGFIVNGKKVEANKGSDYISLSPEEFARYRCGVCWDFCCYEDKWFKQNGYKYNLYFMASNYNRATHTFLIFKDNGKFYIFESSWYPMQGIHEYSSEKEAYMDYLKTYKSKHSSDKYILFSYKQPKKYHMSAMDFLNYIYDNGTLLVNEKNMYEEMISGEN